MIAAPYRPPHVDVRSLVATIYFSKDSLWWHGARMRLPASEVTGDGRIGFVVLGALAGAAALATPR